MMNLIQKFHPTHRHYSTGRDEKQTSAGFLDYLPGGRHINVGLGFIHWSAKSWTQPRELGVQFAKTLHLTTTTNDSIYRKPCNKKSSCWRTEIPKPCVIDMSLTQEKPPTKLTTHPTKSSGQTRRKSNRILSIYEIESRRSICRYVHQWAISDVGLSISILMRAFHVTLFGHENVSNHPKNISLQFQVLFVS